MKTCHVCKCKCDDFAELCPDCGADLTAEALEVAELEKTALEGKTELVLLATMEDVVSAEIFQDILKDNGIVFSCADMADEGAMRVTFGGSLAATEIYVDNKDFEAAKALYDEFLEAEAGFGEEFFDESELFEADGE